MQLQRNTFVKNTRHVGAIDTITTRFELDVVMFATAGTGGWGVVEGWGMVVASAPGMRGGGGGPPATWYTVAGEQTFTTNLCFPFWHYFH